MAIKKRHSALTQLSFMTDLLVGLFALPSNKIALNCFSLPDSKTVAPTNFTACEKFYARPDSLQKKEIGFDRSHSPQFRFSILRGGENF
jgi:hypothetical protein